MAARAPLDVDLEDKLVYGLTPTRLAYMAVALVLGFALWSSHWAPPIARVATSAVVIVVGAAAAWGRWRGRAADRWAVDIVLFVLGNYRVEATFDWRRWGALPLHTEQTTDAIDAPGSDDLPVAA